MIRTRAVLIWATVILAVTVPVIAALNSPFLAFRDAIYITAGLAGIVAFTLLLVQPLLAAGHLPGLTGPHGRRAHRMIGPVILALIILHVFALWLTSPPDVIDALRFVSPTPFSAWGVIAMWAVFATALLATLRKRLRLSPRAWRRAHGVLALIIVAGTVAHALLIEGTMELISKITLSALVLLVSAIILARTFSR